MSSLVDVYVIVETSVVLDVRSLLFYTTHHDLAHSITIIRPVSHRYSTPRLLEECVESTCLEWDRGCTLIRQAELGRCSRNGLRPSLYSFRVACRQDRKRGSPDFLGSRGARVQTLNEESYQQVWRGCRQSQCHSVFSVKYFSGLY